MQGAGLVQNKLDRLTILDMLDALESCITAMHAKDGEPAVAVRAIQEAFPEAHTAPGISQTLLIEMQRAGLSKAEFCGIFDVHMNILQSWLTGSHPPPSWVPVCVRILALLAPPARQGLLKSAEPRKGENPVRSHPFSKIEEL